MMIRAVGLVLFLVAISSSLGAQAQEAALCGSPPTPEVLKELSSGTKGNVEGKAQAILKVLGADISGNIERERRTLYQTTDSSERVRADFYLAYLTCVLLMKDTTMSTEQKLEAIRALHSPIPTGSSKRDTLYNFLAQFRGDTTIDSAREAFGAPKTRRNLTVKEGETDKSYVMERYSVDGVEVALIGSSPFRAIAVSIVPPYGTDGTVVNVPVPYNAATDANDKLDASQFLGAFPLSDLNQSCDGAISLVDEKFLVAATPACNFGRYGGYNLFVFGFSATDASNDCSFSPTDLDKKSFQKITCPGFWKTKPTFALVFLPTKSDPDDDQQENALAVNLAAKVMEALYHAF